MTEVISPDEKAMILLGQLPEEDQLRVVEYIESILEAHNLTQISQPGDSDEQPSNGEVG